MKHLHWIAPLLSLGLAAAGAHAQDLDAALKLTGEARTRGLEEGAKKEGGEVMVYHSTQTSDLRPVFDAFAKKYGIKVKDWRSSSENVVQRIVNESKAGKRDVDFVENNSPEQEALVREKLLRTMQSPYFADMRKGTVPAHRQWATSTIDVFVQAYNTDRVKKEEIPKTYEGLKDPKWKGRLGIEADDYGWFGTMVETIGKDKAVPLFRDIIAANGISVRKGHTLLAQLVATGEIPLALTVYNYKPMQLKERGAPIDYALIQPVLAQMHAVSVVAKAAHPFSAALLFDFFLSPEGQQQLASKHFVPSTTKIQSPFSNVEFRFLDPQESLDKNDAWLKQYEDLVIRGSKG